MTDGDKYYIVHRSSTGKFVLTKSILKNFLNLADNDSLLLVPTGNGAVQVRPFNPLRPVSEQVSVPTIDTPVIA